MFHKFKYLMDILFNKNEYHFNEHVTLMEIIYISISTGDTYMFLWNKYHLLEY